MKAAAKRAIYKRWGKVAHTSVANEEPPTTQPPLQGARIIGLDRLLASISELTTHSAACGGKRTVAGETWTCNNLVRGVQWVWHALHT